MSLNNFTEKKKNIIFKILDLLIDLIDYLNFVLTKTGTLINSPSVCAFSWKLAIKRHNFKTQLKKKIF